jgi:hypothetical protein
MVETAHPEERAVCGPFDREQPDPFPLVKILCPLGDRSECEREIGPPNHRATSRSAFRPA